MREDVPVPYDNLFQSTLTVIFGLGPMIGQAMANGHLNKIIFLPGALEMVSKETSLDPSVAVSPERHLFSTWSCKPGKYHTALPKLNIQTFRAKVLTNAKQIFQLSGALKYLSKEMLFASIRPALSEKRLSSR